MIYLDSAATTLQKPPQVARAAARAIGSMSTPGRGGHRYAMAAADTAFACRSAAAELFGVSDPSRVVFTFNATHGLNLAIRSLIKPGDTVLISGFEHNSVTRPLHAMEGVRIKIAGAPLFDRQAMLEAVRRELTGEVKAVVMTHVSNVFGFVLPIGEIAQLCRARSVPLIVDASQSAGCLEVNLEDWGAAFVAMPGHKGLYGPQGTGLLLCGAEAKPLLAGGTGSDSKRQEMPPFLPDMLEAGTHNMPGIAGLLEGLRFLQRRGTGTILRHETALIRRLGAGLQTIPGVEVFLSQDAEAQAGVISFRHTGLDCEELGEDLSRRGIAVRAGLHCAPLAHESAGTLDSGTVRASVSAFTTERELHGFLQALGQICA